MNIFHMSTSVPRDPQHSCWSEPSGTDAAMHYTAGKKASAEGRLYDFLQELFLFLSPCNDPSFHRISLSLIY